MQGLTRRKTALCHRIQRLYQRKQMPYNEYKKYMSRGYLEQHLNEVETYVNSRYLTFTPGQPVIYTPLDIHGNVYKVEAGIVKRMNDDNTCAFVWYHSGCTAASTNVVDLEPCDMTIAHKGIHQGCKECLWETTR